MVKKSRNKVGVDFKNKSLLNAVWDLPNKPIKGLKLKRGFLTRIVPKDPVAYLNAFNNNWEEFNKLPVDVVEAYHGGMPKIYFKGGGTVKSLDVAVSSTQAEDEVLLHKMYQKTIESD
ncbi:MAG: hypothetical protein ACD_37C00047G0002 [uncultured bacterium]|nr:MAG: hypothetical protein ACD_37C00047G0002 [uncultured bacterium]